MAGIRTIQHYQLTEQIGGGGMGVVWRAVDTLLGREVALKFLHDTAAADPASRERFFREAKAASALNHPNIITIYEINSVDGEWFIAMELVHGLALSALLRSQKRLAPSLTVDYALQLCGGLGAAHRAGIVHRDIKPSNLMVSTEGIIKILDFGLARSNVLVREAAAAAGTFEDPLSAAGVVLGTVPYMSPEQATGDAVGPRSDVFSTGIVLYEMLSGERPFRGSTNCEILQALLSPGSPPLLGPAGGVPERLAEIVGKCLRKKPEERYRDGAEVVAHLKSLDRGAWTRPVFDATTVAMTIPAKTRNLRVRARRMAAVALLAISALFAGYQWGPFGRNPNAADRAPIPGKEYAAAVQAQSAAVKQAEECLNRYDRKGNIDSAIEMLEPLARRADASAAVLATLAEAYLWKSHVESSDERWVSKAMDSAGRAVAITPELADAHVSKGKALKKKGLREEAAAEFEIARRLDPLSAPAHLGLAELESGAEAERLHKKAVELSPGRWIPVLALGIYYHRNARYEESADAFREALRLCEGNVRVMSNLGAALHKLGKDAEASNILQKALRIDESFERLYANLTTALYFQGNYLAAAGAAKKATELWPERYTYWGNLGDCYRSAEGLKSQAPGAYQEAIRLVRKAARSSAGDPRPRCALSAYLARSGDIPGAMAELPPSEQIKDADSLFHVMLVYELSHNRTAALDALERAIRVGVSMHEVANEPDFLALRSDARYARIARSAAALGR